MKKTMIVAAAAAASLTMIAPAGAADMYGRYGQPAPYTVSAPLNVYSWAGPYLGANLGYQWGGVSNAPHDPSGVTGGIQAGYAWQTGQFVFGVETDIQLSAAEDKFAAWKFSNPWFGTLRGRVGVAFNNILVYGTAGLAYGRVGTEVLGLRETHSSIGWAAGIGLELGLTQNWSVRAEYLYTDLGEHNYLITGRPHEFDSSVFRMGVNYRF